MATPASCKWSTLGARSDYSHVGWMKFTIRGTTANITVLEKEP